MTKPVGINVASGFGFRTKEPYVALRVRDVAVQLSPADARHVGQWLLEAAEGAETDAFIWAFAGEFANDEGMDRERICGGMLREFREFRERQREQVGKEPR